jgi:hypothetical protein
MVLARVHELNVRTWVRTFLNKPMNLINIRTSVPTFLTKPTNIYQFLVVDVLKTTHEGDEVTKITKRETIEGELGRFRLRQGEEPRDMYNRLKTLVNQVRNLGSKKWDDHEMVKVILRSLVFLNPTQVQLICGNPRYTLMTPEEVIGNFVSFELMIKGSKKINKLDGPSTSEAQPVAFKATEERKEESTSSRTPIDASKLDNEEMALIIKSFRQILNKGGGRITSPAPRKYATNVVSPVISLLNVHYLVIVTGAMTRRGEEEILQEEGRRCPCLPGVGLRRELHRLLLRRGRHKHRRHQGSSLPQRWPQVPHGKGRQKEEGKIKILH